MVPEVSLLARRLDGAEADDQHRFAGLRWLDPGDDLDRFVEMGCGLGGQGIDRKVHLAILTVGEDEVFAVRT